MRERAARQSLATAVPGVSEGETEVVRETLTLLCPITKTRLKVPAKGKNCTHRAVRSPCPLPHDPKLHRCPLPAARCPPPAARCSLLATRACALTGRAGAVL
jgi:hypothetical protein